MYDPFDFHKVLLKFDKLTVLTEKLCLFKIIQRQLIG